MLCFLSGVNSDFDFCQSAIKKIFNDEELMTTVRDTTGYCLRQATHVTCLNGNPDNLSKPNMYLNPPSMCTIVLKYLLFLAYFMMCELSGGQLYKLL